MDGEVKKRSHAKKKPQEGRNERGQFTKDHKIAENVRFQKENAAACKYKDEYADEIVDYFLNSPSYPTFEEFATKHRVVMNTLRNWREQSQRFEHAYTVAQQIQKSRLVSKSLDGTYNAQFAKFLASAEFGMSEKTTTDSNVSFTVTLPKEIDEESN